MVLVRKAKLYRQFVVGALGLLAATLANADYSTLHNFYIGGAAGYGKVDASVPNAVNNNSGLLWMAKAGYHFTRYLGVEGGYINLPNVKSNGIYERKQNNIIYGAVVGTMPLKYGFDVYGKAGLATVHTRVMPGFTNEGSYSKLTGLVGAGVGYAITPNLSFNLEADMTNKSGQVPASHAVLLGLSYSF